VHQRIADPQVSERVERHVLVNASTFTDLLKAIVQCRAIPRPALGVGENWVVGLLALAPSVIFAVPGLMKITVIQKPAVKARMGMNPFTKQEQMFKAKPARKVIKVRALKALKDMAK
jgi:hypothetical protein